MNREEKSLCYVAMVAKFLDDNKPIKSIRTNSNLSDQFHLIWHIVTKFSLDRIYCYLSLEKESDNFCVVFTESGLVILGSFMS